MNIYDYIEAGFKCFGLLGATDHDGSDLDAKQAYKKPYASNWQHTPDWSDEQLETMEEMGQLDTGFGVLVNGYIVIDIDPRNGGFESYAKMAFDYEAVSGFVVATGGGGKHIYFKAPENTALSSAVQHLPGVDFKSSGYVVGAGSLHASGLEYEAIKGHPCDVGDAPQCLIELLKKPDRYRAKTSLGTIDVSADDVRAMISHIDADCDYDTWIRCGMAINHTLNGDGFEIWDEWSKSGKKYSGYPQLERHWHSFGKSGSPVTLGTLIHHAEQGGYKQQVSVEFQTDIVDDEPIKLDTNGIDLKRPPGFVGELTAWINSQSIYPRESLAVAAAITAIGNIGGLRYYDSRDNMSSNLFSFCVAGSSTGKESIMQCFAECLRAAGISSAVHGGIKSEQEIIRNLTRHQAAFYCIDEMGIVLKKIMSAGSKNGASYLEGVVGLLMSAYSKANSFLPVSGDVKDAIKSELINELGACRKIIENNEDKTGRAARRLEQIERAIEHINSGLERPFLSLIGFTTPVTFNGLVDFENATNGFLSRSMIFDEPETNPMPNKKRKKGAMPDSIKHQLANIYAPGEYSTIKMDRVEYYGDKTPIDTRKDASEMLDEILMHFLSMAEDAKENGLEAIPRRGFELVAKISFILSIPEGVRTVEHVRWAFALVKSDISRKMRLAYANMEQSASPANSIAAKIQSILTDSETAITRGVLINRCRPAKKEDAEKVIDQLVKDGFITESLGARKSKQYQLA